jgi:hypothetical protein
MSEDDPLLISVARRDTPVASASEMRDRLIDALEVRMCQHARSPAFAALVRDVLDAIENGDIERGLPPMLLIANPSPEHVRSCKRTGVACPPMAHVEDGLAVVDLAASWERRIKRLVKPCVPLADGRKRVVEARFHESRSPRGMSRARGSAGYWSLLLECGHTVRRSVSSGTKDRVPKFASCCHCDRKPEDL